MIAKEQRSVSFAQSEREKIQLQYQRQLKPPTLKSSTQEVQLSSRTNGNQNHLNLQVPPLNPRKNSNQIKLDHQKSYDSQMYDGEQKLTQGALTNTSNLTTNTRNDIQLQIVIQNSSSEHTFDEDNQDQQLSSQRSLKTLKSLHSERLNRKVERKRSDTGNNNDDIGFQFQYTITNKSYLNDSQGQIQLRTQEAHQQMTQRMKLSQNPFQLQDPYLSIEKTKKETMQSMGTNNQLHKNQLQDNQFHSRRMSKSSANILREDPSNMLQTSQKQWYQQTQKTSMVQGERDSLDGVSEQSFLEIPNEHINLHSHILTQQSSGDKKQMKISPERKGTQRSRQVGQSQIQQRKPTYTVQQSTQSLIKPNNINTVRDSSPLKTIGLFTNIREIQNQQRGSLSERQRFMQFNSQEINTKMFTQRSQYGNNFKGQTQIIENSYKQPKQGQKRQQISQQSKQPMQTVQTQQFHTQFSPQMNIRESILKNSQLNSNYVTQSNPNIDHMRQFQSDFVHSKEEEDFEIINHSDVQGINGHEQSSFNISQTFHLPNTQALHNTQKVQNLFSGINPKINSLQLRGASQCQLSQKLNTYQDEQQPISGNLNDLQRPSIRENKFYVNEMRTFDNTNKRANSNFRNESLERILGDKANSLFDQIEKITRKDYVRVNRSILHTSNDRGESLTRGLSQTPILIQKEDDTINHEKIKEPRTNHIQRKRQLTFTNSNKVTNSNYQLQLQDSQNQCIDPNFLNQKHAIDQIDDSNILQTEKKLNEYPKSPTNFPSSVKNKIKNITERMKQEISKQDDQHPVQQQIDFTLTSSQIAQNCNYKQSTISSNNSQIQLKKSSIQVEGSHKNQIKQVNMKDHFKKYLNGGQKLNNEKQNKVEEQTQYKLNLKKVRNSNIETNTNQSSMFTTNINKHRSSKFVAKQNQANQNQTKHPNFLKKQSNSNQSSNQNNIEIVFLPKNNEQNSPKKEQPLSSMFQKRRQSAAEKQSKPTQVKKNSITQNSQFMQSIKRSQENIVQQTQTQFKKKKKKGMDFECIIYMPNQPPEILKTSQIIQEKQEENKNQVHNQTTKIEIETLKQTNTFDIPIQSSQQELNISKKQVEDKENIESLKSSRVMQRNVSSRIDLKIENQNNKNNVDKNRGSKDYVDESLIQAKYNNLLKETRQKIQEADCQTNQNTPKHKSFKQMTQFLTISNQNTEQQKLRQNDIEDLKQSTLRKSYNFNSLTNSFSKQKFNSRQQSIVSSPKQNLRNSLVKENNQVLKDQRQDFNKIQNKQEKSKQIAKEVKQRDSNLQPQHDICANKYQHGNLNCQQNCVCSQHNNLNQPFQQAMYGSSQVNQQLFGQLMTPEMYNNYYIQMQQQQLNLPQFQPYPQYNTQIPVMQTPYQQQMSKQQHNDQLFPMTPAGPLLNLNQNQYFPYQYQTLTPGMTTQNLGQQQFAANNFCSPYNTPNMQQYIMPQFNQIPLDQQAMYNQQQIMMQRTQMLSGLGMHSTNTQFANYNQKSQKVQNTSENMFHQISGNNSNSNDNHLSLGAQLEKALNEFDKLDDME